MKRFSHFKLTKELKLLFIFRVVILLYSFLPDYYLTLHVQRQQLERSPPESSSGLIINMI